MKLLLEKGADVKSKDGGGQTPLSRAARPQNGFKATEPHVLGHGGRDAENSPQRRHFLPLIHRYLHEFGVKTYL